MYFVAQYVSLLVISGGSKGSVKEPGMYGRVRSLVT